MAVRGLARECDAAGRGPGLRRLVWFAPLVLTLAGCQTAPQDPTAMIPANIQATVMAEDHLRQAREAANSGDPSASPTTVEAMLARARTAENAAPAPAEGAAGAPPAGAGAGSARAAASATGAGPAGAAPSATPKRPAPGREFEIVFDGSEDKPSAKAQAAFAAAWKAGKVPDKAKVMISAGPASAASAFDQALLANRRLRTVRSLLPAEIDAKQLYDPDMPPDTVRIVVGTTD
ncbi:hypothetical protein [Azorhizobium doebereinerae]|uniref:hypothetical protein n=1 Tax=Azorhizobium doebereinerae TaxID=281091 RepID=UPI0012EC9F9C|nr:hypothetical protein [Azorhizobium doebereinerae]